MSKPKNNEYAREGVQTMYRNLLHNFSAHNYQKEATRVDYMLGLMSHGGCAHPQPNLLDSYLGVYARKCVEPKFAKKLHHVKDITASDPAEPRNDHTLQVENCKLVNQSKISKGDIQSIGTKNNFVQTVQGSFTMG